MLSNEFDQFYKNWKAKADEYSENELRDLFDKYITLFVIFNYEYNEIVQRLRENGNRIYNRFDDRKAATDWTLQFIGSKNLIDRIKGLNPDVEKIIQLIEQEQFYIKLNWGNRQRNQDLKILKKLKSNNQNEKAKGILEVIYYVRCNLFHGHKQYIEYQKDLLQPLLRILDKLVTLCRERIIN